jgi:hypothetical protein
VTVVAPKGSTTVADVFEVTPFVFGPGAAPGGRATFESPLDIGEYPVLIDGEFEDKAFGDDTMLFLAGEHTGGVQIVLVEGGVTVRGEGAATTTVTGASFYFAGGQVSSPNTIRDLTLVSPGGSAGQVGEGSVVELKDVVLIGGGLSAGGNSQYAMLFFDNVSYDGQGSGRTALEVTDLVMTNIRNSRFSDCGVAIDVATTKIFPPFGHQSVADSTFEGCDTGMRLRFTVFPDERLISWPSATIENSEFIDVATGITASAELTVSNTVFSDNEATETPSRTAIHISDGSLIATNVTITGHDIVGVAAVSPDPQQSMYVTLSEMFVEGGQRGIDFSGGIDSGSLSIQSSIVRDQTVSAVSVSSSDLFLIDLKGNNQLSVTAGFALEDRRAFNDSSDVIEAAGITLNGNSYSGLIEGPAEVPPDYWISASGVIQF